jgi:hypothetical protein
MAQRSFVSDVGAFVSIGDLPERESPCFGVQRLDERTAPLSLERKPSVRSPVGVPPSGALREVAFAKAVKCPVERV